MPKVMLASTHEGVIHDQPEQGSLFPAERVFPSGTRDGKSGESVRRARPCRRKEAQEDRTNLEQRSPQADRRCATTTLGKGAESCCQASQVVTAVIIASTANGLVRNFSQRFASEAGAERQVLSFESRTKGTQSSLTDASLDDDSLFASGHQRPPMDTFKHNPFASGHSFVLCRQEVTLSVRMVTVLHR